MVVTVTSTVPAACGGDTTVIEVEVEAVTVAATLPKLTPSRPRSCCREMVSVVPPAVLPLPVDSDVTDGSVAAVKVYSSLLLDAESPWA